MTEPDAHEPALGLQDRLEEWIYALNEKEHWIFRLYDWGNEIWARLVFRALRRRAALHDERVTVGETEARVRFLTPADEADFVSLLGSFDVRYLPPHPLDADSARRALARSSYLPYGIWIDGELKGYILLRMFFFRRAVTGIWMLASTHSGRVGRHTLNTTVDFLRREKVPNYCTIPIDNEPSLRIAHWCGWRVIRTNRRFHVLRVEAPAGEDLRERPSPH